MVGRFVEADAVCDVRVAVLVAELAAVTMVAVSATAVHRSAHGMCLLDEACKSLDHKWKPSRALPRFSQTEIRSVASCELSPDSRV